MGTLVEVEGRTLSLSNLDKVLYPSGFTKAEVIDYYTRIAPVLLPHLSGRCITLRRYPDGSDTEGFFEKRCPQHRPDWLPVAAGPGDRRGAIEYCELNETAALVWSANMAALELHAPMALASDLERPTTLVFDLDPGPECDISDCCEVALGIREILHVADMEGWCKTSGSKGLQLYVPLNVDGPSHDDAADVARAVGQVLAQQLPGRTTIEMAKARRSGRVFVDWSQNARHKTTVAPYSLRARREPTVSTPVSWDEVAAGAERTAELRFLAPTVLERVARHGDLFAPVLTEQHSLPNHRR